MLRFDTGECAILLTHVTYSTPLLMLLYPITHLAGQRKGHSVAFRTLFSCNSQSFSHKRYCLEPDL